MVALRKTSEQVEPVVTNREDKGNGYIVYTVKRHQMHTVTRHPDGSMMCLDQDNERCLGHKFSRGECSHVRAARDLECAIAERAKQDRQEMIDAAEYAAWKHEHGLDVELDADQQRAQYVQEFDIYG